MKICRMLILGLTCLGLISCATPTYSSKLDDEGAISSSAGLTYFLPRQLHKAEFEKSKNGANCETKMMLTESDLVGDHNFRFVLSPQSTAYADNG